MNEVLEVLVCVLYVIAFSNMIPCLQGYFRAAKASAGQGNKTKAIKYLEDGIKNCADTKDLEDYHQKLIKEEKRM